MWRKVSYGAMQLSKGEMRVARAREVLVERRPICTLGQQNAGTVEDGAACVEVVVINIFLPKCLFQIVMRQWGCKPGQP